MGVRHEPWAPGTPAWVDLSVTDLERSKAFYTAVLGWDYTGGEVEYGGYVNAVVGGETVAGMAPPMEGMEETPHVWTTFLAVDDATAALEQVSELGGQVVFPAMQVGPLGSMGMAVDPTGAAFGVWQSGEHTGCNRYNEPGSLVWTDGMLGDLEAGKAFYAEVFGYSYEDVSGSDGPYVMARVDPDGEPVGGLGQVEEGTPPHWATNFGVHDADEAARQVVEAGGQVVVQPFDFEWGRMAVVAGPDGEQFGVVALAAAG